MLVLYGIVEVINHTFLALDEIFYPSYKKVIIKSPLFIISMPRTGSTWLQKVICEDHEQFTSMKLWEMLFAPSIIQKKFFIFLSKVDGHFNNFLTRRLYKRDKKLFKAYMPIHPCSMFDYEDDDLLLVHTFSNMFLVFFFPKLKLYDFLVQFDHSPDERRKRKILVFYKKCIQKHLYLYGKDKIYLSKSASFSPRMNSLQRLFPDSCFIYTLRTPEQSVASTISLAIRLSEVFHTGISRNIIIERTLNICDRLYYYPLEAFRNWPKKRYLLHLYTDLTENVEKEIIMMYGHFGFKLSENYLKFLESERIKTKSYRSQHIYSPENWNLSSQEINNRYKESYEKYTRFVSKGR